MRNGRGRRDRKLVLTKTNVRKKMTNKSYHHSSLQLVATFWLLVCSAAFLSYSIANPIAEWDMLAYAASADAMDGGSAEQIHSQAYFELQERLSAEEFEVITNKNNYRHVMYTDAQAFNEQLPYYSIRVSFNALLAKLNKLGLNIYDAGYWVTAAAFVLSLLLLWGSLNDRIHPVLQMMFPIMFFKFTMDLDVVRHILADSLSSVWVVFICIAYIRGTRLLLPLIALSAFVRVDLAIFAGLFLLLLFFTSERKNYFSLFVCGAVMVTNFLLVQEWAGSYGWKTLYYFAIISDMMATHPSEYGQLGFTLGEYVSSLMESRWISRMYIVTAAIVIANLVLWKSGSLGEHNKKFCRVSAVCVLYIAAHYLIFPQLYLRFFVGQNMVIFACFAVLCTHYWHAYVDDRRRNVRLPGNRVVDVDLLKRMFSVN